MSVIQLIGWTSSFVGNRYAFRPEMRCSTFPRLDWQEEHVRIGGGGDDGFVCNETFAIAYYASRGCRRLVSAKCADIVLVRTTPNREMNPPLLVEAHRCELRAERPPNSDVNGGSHASWYLLDSRCDQKAN